MATAQNSVADGRRSMRLLLNYLLARRRSLRCEEREDEKKIAAAADSKVDGSSNKRTNDEKEEVLDPWWGFRQPESHQQEGYRRGKEDQVHGHPQRKGRKITPRAVRLSTSDD